MKKYHSIEEIQAEPAWLVNNKIFNKDKAFPKSVRKDDGYKVIDKDKNIYFLNKDIFEDLYSEGDIEEASDGYHTFNELYEYRKLYNAAFFNEYAKHGEVIKSKRHSDGEKCFGGGWFIIMAKLPTGQISNHYELKDWDLFKCKEMEKAWKWDKHSPSEAAKRLKNT